MRVVSIVANLLLLTLVTPREFGVLAVVRGLLGVITITAESGIAMAMVRRPSEPTKEEYGALGGMHSLVLMAVGLLVAAWPGGLLGPELGHWRWWTLAFVASMAFVPLGIGARVRLQRQLEYKTLTILDVANVVVQNVGLLAFALANRFTMGVFIVLGVGCLGGNLALYLCSPGPKPAFRPKPIARLARASHGFVITSWLFAAREHATPVLVAGLFGVETAGMWAFAARIGQLLDLTFQGFRSAALPAAGRLTGNYRALQLVSTNALRGAAALAFPVAAVLFVAVPLAGTMWPQWEHAIVLAQMFVVMYAVAGVAGASLEPVAVAASGSAPALAEQLATVIGGWLPLSVAHLYGTATGGIAVAIIGMHLTPVAALFVLTDKRVRPAWTPDVNRLALSLVTSLVLYGVGIALRWGLWVSAIIAVLGVLWWLRPVAGFHPRWGTGQPRIAHSSGVTADEAAKIDPC
jgi:O-antigen/teichoic acid export membrane protein